MHDPKALQAVCSTAASPDLELAFRPSPSYVVVPDVMLSAPEVLRVWIDRSVAGLAAKAPIRRRKPS